MVDVPLQDRMEMMDVIARYSYLCDEGRADEVAELFTPDGVLDATIDGIPGKFAPSGHTKEFVGRDGMRKHLVGGAPEVFGRPGTKQMHMQTNLIFDEFSENSARTRNYLLWTASMSPPKVRDDQGPLILSHGYYIDTWERYEGRWRFKYRNYRPAGYHPIYHDEHAKLPKPE